MKIKNLWYCISIGILIACNSNQEKKPFKLSDYPKRTDSLLVKSVNEGSREAYNQLIFEFFKAGDDYKDFYYSYLIATKFEYPEAYFNLYQSIKPNKGITANDIEYKSFGPQSEVFRYYFLLKAFELAKPNEEIYLSIKSRIEEKFGKDGIIPSSKDFLVKNLK